MTRQRLLGRLISDSALYGLAAAIAKALALLTVPYLTRALSPTGYGIADLATSTAAFLTLVAMFAGDIPAARQYGLASDETARRRVLASYVWATAVVGLVVGVVLLPLAPMIGSTLWGSPELAALAALSVLLVPIGAVQAALVQTERIRSRPGRFAVLSLLDLLAQLVLAVALVAAGFGPGGVILGFVLGSVLGMIVAAAAARDILHVRPDWGAAWRLGVSGIQFLPQVAMFVAADWAVRSVVANAMEPDAVAELGLAIRIASVLSLLGAAFAMAWGPIGLARASDAATARLFGRVLVGYGAASIASALVLAAIGPELLVVLAGPGYDGASIILPGIALAYAIAGTEYVLVIAAGVSDRAWRVAVAATVGATVQIGAAALLVPDFGIAAIGPVAVLGRATSFAILLGGVHSSVLVPMGPLAGVALISLLAFGAVQSAIGHGEAWTAARWAVAIALAAVGIAATARVLRSRPQVAT